MNKRFTLYSNVRSQWAGVAHLAIASKGFTTDEYDVEEVDLANADNWNAAYLEINPKATIPSLCAPELCNALNESIDVLRYIDDLPSDRQRLQPSWDEPATRHKTDKLLALVHSEEMSTSLIFLRARNEEEMQGKQIGRWRHILSIRHEKLGQLCATKPGNQLYETRARENCSLLNLYRDEIGPHHIEFFEETNSMYQTFAEGLETLDELLVLPYAAGEAISEADWHIVPWLSHAMVGAGTEPENINDFSPLESLIQLSVPDFILGSRLKAWWGGISKTEPFLKVFPRLR